MFIVNGGGHYLKTYKKSVKRLHNMKKGIDRQGIKTFGEIMFPNKKINGKRGGGESTLQAPVVYPVKLHQTSVLKKMKHFSLSSEEYFISYAGHATRSGVSKSCNYNQNTILKKKQFCIL